MHHSRSNFASLQYLSQGDLDIQTYRDLSFFKSKKLSILLAFFQSFEIIFISSATTVDELLTLTAGLIKVISRKVCSAVSCLKWKGTYTLGKKTAERFLSILCTEPEMKTDVDQLFPSLLFQPVPSPIVRIRAPVNFFPVRCSVN